ncbi:MAG: carotenoid oxygenase family protein [Polyangiaceae bacterium]|nr:carotenoid oxygenase family protein [Polyangiaceae bacterium]
MSQIAPNAEARRPATRAPGRHEPAAPAPVTLDVFRSLEREHDFRPLRAEGAVPPGLRGTLYRNGPSVFDAGVDPHWFDGTGAVSAVRFTDGGAEGAVRVLHTPSADGDAGRRGASFGAYGQKMSWRRRLAALFGGQSLRNVANINVLAWQKRTFAFYESTLPLEIDPVTLRSIGETDLGGVVAKGMNAHPHRVPARRATYQTGLRVGPKVLLDLFELPDEGAARLLTSVELPGVMEAHDFFATRDHLVLVLPPLWCSSLAMLVDGGFASSLRWRPEEGTRVIVIPIDEPERRVVLDTDALWYWHGVNAFERPDGRIELDLVGYQDFASNAAWIETVTRGGLTTGNGSSVRRAVIDKEARRVSWEERWPHACEFGSVSPAFASQAARVAWLAGYPQGDEGRALWSRIVRLDLQSGDAQRIDPGTRGLVSEPVVVPRSEREDDVWVLAYVHDQNAGATFLGIWDGARPEHDAVARVWFDQQLPPTLHGTFVRA